MRGLNLSDLAGHGVVQAHVPSLGRLNIEAEAEWGNTSITGGLAVHWVVEMCKFGVHWHYVVHIRWTQIALEARVTYVIAFPCIDLKDKSCIEECPVDCIYEGERMLYIQPDECVDCGACEPVCPVEAIYYEDDVPAEWKDYTAANAEFFADLGSPGGASKLGAQNFDAPLLASVPPQQHDE